MCASSLLNLIPLVYLDTRIFLPRNNTTRQQQGERRRRGKKCKTADKIFETQKVCNLLICRNNKEKSLNSSSRLLSSQPSSVVECKFSHIPLLTFSRTRSWNFHFPFVFARKKQTQLLCENAEKGENQI